MKHRTVRVGIIGVGQIGKAHLDNYTKIPDAEVAAIVDIDVPELERVAEIHKITDTYTDYRDLLKRADVDAVDVCLHNNLHAPVTMAALEAGKHVYCEKPMAGAYPDAKAMLATARKCDKKLSIQLGTLFAKETKTARRLIDAGKLGRIYHARSCGFRRRGRPYVDGYGSENFVKKEIAAGGALYDMGVYHIAQLLYLLGQPQIERVTGKVYQETDMDSRRRTTSAYSVEELGMGFVRFAGGLTMDIIESWAIHRNAFEGSSLIGSEGGICLNPFSYHTTLCDVPVNAGFELDDADWRWHKILDDQDAYDSPQQHWIAALQGRVPLLPTAEVALRTMLISQGIYLSDQLGREVTVQEIEERSVSTALKV